MDPSLIRGQHSGQSGCYNGQDTVKRAARSGGARQQSGNEMPPGYGSQSSLPKFGRDSRSNLGSEPSRPAGGGAAAAAQRAKSGFALAAGQGDGTTAEQRRLLDELQYKTSPQHALQQRERHLQTMVILAVVPWCGFVFVELLASLVPWRLFVWTIAAVWFAGFFLLAQVGRQSKSVFYIQLSAFGMLAVVLGGWCGATIYDQSAVNYWMAKNRISHSNVDPAESAEGYIDSNAVNFTEGTRVDVRRTFGLQSPETGGDIVCVAPVLTRALAERREVHFWAAGRDCCEPLSGFRCGQALRAGVRAGAVQSPGGGAGSTLAAKHYAQYNRAAQQAATVYQLSTEARPVFVYWTSEPAAILSSSLDHAFAWAALLSIFYLLISLLIAGAVFWSAVHGFQGRSSSAWNSPPV